MTGYVLTKYSRKITLIEKIIVLRIVFIKGRLKNHLDHWENVISANTVVTSAIKEGYKIPSTYTS